MKKKQSRRSKLKHPELDPRFALKTRADLLDQDYYHKLSDSELDWINKFNKESVSASFDAENPGRNLHKSRKARKECYDRNNARNRDILTKAKASNQLVDYETLVEVQAPVSTEDHLINQLDRKEIQEMIDWIEVESQEHSLDKEFSDELEKKQKVQPSLKTKSKRRSR